MCLHAGLYLLPSRVCGVAVFLPESFAILQIIIINSGFVFLLLEKSKEHNFFITDAEHPGGDFWRNIAGRLTVQGNQCTGLQRDPSRVYSEVSPAVRLPPKSACVRLCSLQIPNQMTEYFVEG